MSNPPGLMKTTLEEAMDELEEIRERDGLDKNGKKYLMVKDRIKIFRKYFGLTYGINTEVQHGAGFGDGATLIGIAKITDNAGNVIGSGHAMEFVNSNEITKTSGVEAVETSSIGRALASIGLHGGEYASGDEMAGVERKQQTMERSPILSNDPVVRHPAIRSDVPPVRFYVPENPFAVYIDYGKEVSKVVDIVTAVENGNQLSEYWNYLTEFRRALDQNDPQMYAELKAAFAVRGRQMEGR